MKITKKTLRTIIKEELSSLHSGDFRERKEFHEGRDQEAISHAKSMRSDNLNFQDFTGLIVDKLNLYDDWVENKSVDEVVDELKCVGKISATFARKKYVPMKGDDTIYSRQAALDPRHTDSEGDF